MKRIATRVQLIGLMLLLATGVMLGVPALALAETPDVSDTIPDAVQWSLPLSVPDGYLDRAVEDDRDVYAVWLDRGKDFEVTLAGSGEGADFDLFLYDTQSFDSTPVAKSAHLGSSESFKYRVTTSGYCYLTVNAFEGDGIDPMSGPGDYTLSARMRAIPYKLTKFTAPRYAKKNKKVSVSVVLAPGYLGSSYYPVTVHSRQWRKGKWVGSALTYSPSGYSVTGGTKFAVKWWANKGTWRLWWTFKDADHKTVKTAYKTITIK